MIGGIFTSFLMELLAYPAIYEIWKRRTAAEPYEVVVEESREEQPEDVAFAVSGLVALRIGAPTRQQIGD